MVRNSKWAIHLMLLTYTLAQPLGALTWEFEQSRQGWTAREGYMTGRSLLLPRQLNNEVDDGIWIITFPPFNSQDAGRTNVSAVQLISPPIGYDSELFDTVRLRLRLRHSPPAECSMLLSWTNKENRQTPETAGNRFFIQTAYQACRTEWEEWVIPLSEYAVSQEDGLVWEGELIDFRPQLIVRRAGGESAEVPLVEIEYT